MKPSGKRKVLIFFTLALTLIMALMVEVSRGLNNVLEIQLISTIIVVSSILGFLFWFGEGIKDAKSIALVSILGSLSAALRLPFAAIPSLQPSTFIIICSGYALGPAAGFLVGTLTVLISNLFLGHGPWTLYQIIGWGLAGALAPALRKFSTNSFRMWVSLVVFGFLWGYVYGLITNLSYWLYFMEPLTLETFLVAEVASLWFDTVHALSNAVFLSLLGLKTVRLLSGFVGKYPKIKF